MSPFRLTLSVSLLLLSSLGLLAAAVTYDARLRIDDIGIGAVASNSNISQMAWGPDGRLYVARTDKQLRSYTYSAGALSDERLVDTDPSGTGTQLKPLGIAFHGLVLYATSGHTTGTGKLWRCPGAVVDGIWTPQPSAEPAVVQIVGNVPVQSGGAHSINQLLIVGDSLFVPIGVSSNTGHVDADNADGPYSGSVAWIEDLNAVVEDGGSWAAVEGIVQQLRASHAEPISTPLTLAQTDPEIAKRKLVVYATGLRNPYGLAARLDGRLWVSNNESATNNHQYYVDGSGTLQAGPGINKGDGDFSNAVHDQLYELKKEADYGWRLHAWRELVAAARAATPPQEPLASTPSFLAPADFTRSHTFDNSFAWRTHPAFVWAGPDEGGSWPTTGPAYDPQNPNAGGTAGGLGPHSSANGMAAIPSSLLPSDLHGHLAITRWSKTKTELASEGGDESITYDDLVAIDPDTGGVRRLAGELSNPLDVLAAPDGSLLIGCYGGGLYRLATAPEEHPRLFLTAARLASVRSEAAVVDSHQARALAALQARVDASSADLLDPYGTGPTGYRRTWLAREAAFLAAFYRGADAAQEAAYAAKAYAALDAVFHGANQDRHLVDQSGLSRAMMGMGFALAYDWAYDSWTSSERDWVRARLLENLDMWPSFSHANVNDPDKNSNWVAVVRGGELVALLATYQEAERPTRLALTVNDLNTHIGSAHGDHGVAQEGLGYLEYGGQFLLTAALAASDAGHPDLVEAMQAHPVWTLLRYSHGFQIQDRKFLQQGVSHRSNFDEGFVSLVQALVPAAEAGRYRFWYDRHLGLANPVRSDEQRFDFQRAGTVWSLIFYDPAISSEDPTGIDAPMLVDDHGFHFFRRRWQDQNDLQLSLHADTEHLNHAWDACEVGAFSIIGYGSRFAGGPGKESASAVAEFNILQVNGALPGSAATGSLVEALPSSRGGRVVVDASAAYASLGVSAYQRQGLVDFIAGENRALFVTLDQVEAPAGSTITWNLNPGAENGDLDGISAASLTVAGRPAFQLTGAAGSLIGIVLSPAAAVLSIGATGEPVQVSCPAEQAILVAMLLDDNSGEMPIVVGSGLDSRLQWQGRELRFDAASQRLVVENANTPPVIDSAIVFAANPVTGTSVGMSVGASDLDGDALTYLWSQVTGPAPIAWNPNGSTSENTLATFTFAGDYRVKVLVSDGRGGSASAEADLVVLQTPTSISIDNE